MTIDTNTMVSITEANQNFSKAARLVDELEISKRLLPQNREAYEVLAGRKLRIRERKHMNLIFGGFILVKKRLFTGFQRRKAV